MRVSYEPIYDVVVYEWCLVFGMFPNVYQNLLYHDVRKYMVLVVAKKIFWIYREYVHKALYSLR